MAAVRVAVLERVQQQRLIQVVAVAVQAAYLQVLQAVLAAQASSSFPTQAHKEAQAAQSHHQVVTQFTHSLHQAHSLPKTLT